MPGEIFISCGQAKPKERELVANISSSLRNKGFNPYVAIEAQSIQDINNEIIGRLKQSDCYIFIDFKRERIWGYLWWKKYRGSLFTNQELAIAYVLGFEHAIVLRQKGVELEGIGKYILSNAKTFENPKEVITLVESEVNNRKWSPEYSRNLIAQYIKSSPGILYRDHTLSQLQQIYHIGIINCRSDVAAINVIAHLVEIAIPGGNVNNDIDRSDLKWARQIGYTRNIPPKETVPFDAFALDEQNPHHVYLHSLSDTHPRIPIINQVGHYILRYQIYSENFPVTEVRVDLNLTGQAATTTAQLVK